VYFKYKKSINDLGIVISCPLLYRAFIRERERERAMHMHRSCMNYSYTIVIIEELYISLLSTYKKVQKGNTKQEKLLGITLGRNFKVSVRVVFLELSHMLFRMSLYKFSLTVCL